MRGLTDTAAQDRYNKIVEEFQALIQRLGCADSWTARVILSIMGGQMRQGNFGQQLYQRIMILFGRGGHENKTLAHSVLRSFVEPLQEFLSRIPLPVSLVEAFVRLMCHTTAQDRYNKIVEEFQASNQQGPTCLMHSCAASICFAMNRIIGRQGGYPTFAEVYGRIFAHFGGKGKVYENDILAKFVGDYRLFWSPLPCELNALQEAKNHCPVVGFQFTNKQWAQFRGFFAANPGKVLTMEVLRGNKYPLSIENASKPNKYEGHSVVLLDIFEEGETVIFRFLNSWGKDWNDCGRFNVAWDIINHKPFKFEFLEVFWRKGFLLTDEKEEYCDFETTALTKLGEWFFPQREDRVNYICPHCQQIVWIGKIGKFKINYEGPCFECIVGYLYGRGRRWAHMSEGGCYK